jgi:hypothetical protein
LLFGLVAIQAVISVGYGLAWMFYALTQPASATVGIVTHLLTFYPVVFLGVGLAVLLLRPMDSHAWLMALLFASFISVPEFPVAARDLPPGLTAFVLGYRAVGLTAIPAFFYAFLTRFPVRSPLDLRFPWLRWLNAAGVLLFGVTSIRIGAPQSPPWMVGLLGEFASDLLRLAYLFAGIPLGVAALFLNAWGATAPDARRKARVLVWGTAAGAMPIVLQSASELLLDVPTPTWVATAALLMSSILPVSFAYAVVKHRVLDVPVLLKRSARYLLVRRGLAVLLLAMASLVTAVFTPLLSWVAAVSRTWPSPSASCSASRSGWAPCACSGRPRAGSTAPSSGAPTTRRPCSNSSRTDCAPPTAGKHWRGCSGRTSARPWRLPNSRCS